jgi:uncharacterized damage-inducible protein DinB
MDSTTATIDSFLEGPSLVRQALAGMNGEHLQARPVAGRWSTLEVVCHLVDSDQAWCHRIKRTIAEERPLQIGYDETRFTAALAYNERDVEAELNLLEAMRIQLGAILRAIPAEAWDRTCVHNERGLMTVREMVEIEAEHVRHHVRFIREKRVALGLPSAT